MDERAAISQLHPDGRSTESHISIVVAYNDSGTMCCRGADSASASWCILLHSQPPDKPAITVAGLIHSNKDSQTISVECMMSSNVKAHRDNSVFTLLEVNSSTEYHSNKYSDSNSLEQGVNIFSRRQKFSHISRVGTPETALACRLRIIGHHQFDRTILAITQEPDPPGEAPAPNSTLSSEVDTSSIILITTGVFFALVVAGVVAILTAKKCKYYSANRFRFHGEGDDQNGDNDCGGASTPNRKSEIGMMKVVNESLFHLNLLSILLVLHILTQLQLTTIVFTVQSLFK
jgi:hypothetical protein